MNLQARMLSSGETGVFLEMKTGTGFIESNKFGGIATSGVHQAILVDDIVFDNLRPGGILYSDWISDLGGQIYELPEEYRTLDSFKKYFQAYIFSSYDSAEKKLLFNLMMDITNDMIEMDVEKGNIAWSAVSYILAKDKGQFQKELEYWGNEDEPIDNSFAITSRVRSVISQED